MDGPAVSLPGEGTGKGEIERVTIAEAAATAARAVDGVVRLQPGLVGLLKQFAAQAWERATGRPMPDIAGIDVDLRADGTVHLDVRIVTAIDRHTAAVGAAVHTAVTAAVETATGRVPQVRVRVVEIDLEPTRS